MSEQTLLTKINVHWDDGDFQYEQKGYITENLNRRIKLRPYQEEALARFEYYFDDYKHRHWPMHLLFHMATGSGKTVVMAANILYLYKKGYRNFIFFVNATNVIEKTRVNFLDPSSSKFLFSEKIVIDDKIVEVKEVENFDASDKDAINIHFTTVQGLHSRINEPRENAVTLEELKDKKIVLLSDEAHHINALTKKSLSKTEENYRTWESTIDRVFTSNDENVMLAYTATVELKDPKIAEKYSDKIIYQYDLQKFCADKYSKEIRLLQTDSKQKQRILQAILLSQYRRKVAQNNGIDLKPCLLFKSPTIAASEEVCAEFGEIIKNLRKDDISKIEKDVRTSIIAEAFRFFKKHDISTHNLVRELKEDFRPERILMLNSKSEADDRENQILVNSLEDEKNEIRAIFVVNMLNEGWDVLNLFDIVRLDESKGTKSTTLSEAQLIGRGARYWPFMVGGDGEEFKRKFDEEPRSELSCLEELYYHSINNNQYITDLKKTLEEMGIQTDPPKITRELRVKDEVKKTRFWKEEYVFFNERQAIDRNKINSLTDLARVGTRTKHDVGTGKIVDKEFFSSDNKEEKDRSEYRDFTVKDLGYRICRKAIDKKPFFHFDNLRISFPHLETIDEFITSNDYCGQLYIPIFGSKKRLENLSPSDKLDAATLIFESVKKYITENSRVYFGSKEFRGKRIKEVVKDKELNFTQTFGEAQSGKSIINNPNAELSLDVTATEWFAQTDNFGTSEEKHLIKYIESVIDKMKQKYEDIYLVRNAGFIALYDFDEGRRHEPDFLLFMKDKENGESLNYQLFIEPKGEQLIEHDKWKEDFLKRIEEEGEVEKLLEGIAYDSENYRLIGLPFYNMRSKYKSFCEEFEKSVGE